MKENQEKYQLGQIDSLRTAISTMMFAEWEAPLLKLTSILLKICPLIMEGEYHQKNGLRAMISI
jgi:hypothetical protein